MGKRIVWLGIAMMMLAMGGAVGRADDAKTESGRPDIQKEALETVKNVCMKMKPFMTRPDKLKEVKLDPMDEINAFADMKGNVTFTMGMINFLQSEDEAALICGHEMEHISGQHIKRSIGTMILATVAAGALGGTAGDVVGTAIQSKQSRKHERESDATGLMYLWQAGFDPRVAPGFWTDFMNRNGDGGGGVLKFLTTHPVDKERVNNMKVLLYKDCETNPALRYCDEIKANPDLKAAYDKFGK